MTKSINLKLKITLTLVSSFIVGQTSSQFVSSNGRVPVEEDNVPIRVIETTDEICGDNEFECKNGACIETEFVCDGRIDCADQSDELVSLCSKPERVCQEGQFRCEYGACAPVGSACNGIRDCFDNSDEILDECPRPLRHGALVVRVYDLISNPYTKELGDRIIRRTTHGGKNPLFPTNTQNRMAPLTSTTTTVTPQPPTTTTTTTTTTTSSSTTTIPNETPATIFCLAPSQPQNGKWRLAAQISESRDWEVPEGAQVPTGSILKYTCNAGYALYGSANRKCQANGSYTAPPECRFDPLAHESAYQLEE